MRRIVRVHARCRELLGLARDHGERGCRGYADRGQRCRRHGQCHGAGNAGRGCRDGGSADGNTAGKSAGADRGRRCIRGAPGWSQRLFRPVAVDAGRGNLSRGARGDGGLRGRQRDGLQRGAASAAAASAASRDEGRDAEQQRGCERLESEE